MIRNLQFSGSSRVAGRGPCPACRARGQDRTGDNLIAYSNGSAHCFSCNYHLAEPAAKVAKIKSIREALHNGKVVDFLQFPPDATSDLSAEARLWVAKYGIRKDELARNGVKWSPSKSYLLFPVTNYKDELVYWSARNFSGHGPKYISRGNLKGHLPIIRKDKNSRTKSIVAVEDMLSAIKVSRNNDAFMMLSASVSMTDASRLSHQYERLILWGDQNKQIQNATKRTSFAPLFNKGCGVILSQKDPKEYDNLHITNFIKQQASVPSPT